MNTLENLSGPILEPLSKGTPECAVIFLHGYGANGADLLSLGKEWAPAFPNILFASPNAPFPCQANPSGYQWFNFTPDDMKGMIQEIHLATSILDKYIESLMGKYDLDPEKIVLVGFSQGTVMAFASGLKKSFGGILGYSGAVVNDGKIFNHLANPLPLVSLVHGEQDQVIPVSTLHYSVDQLKSHNIPAEWKIIKGLEHGIDRQGLQIGQAFLEKIFTPL
ncbi:MAG: phospholipase [Alphaproteobacteria bacterium]|jgi:phospholipase/carboxylesterase|nr:phospholipase [Alphaproteobacteria bacterium]MBT5390114.1 phospholipase [Alphaproteobacteria bacterium]MBT5654624.1 phospholipase [Alphaproteobacteria bacterium]